MDEIFEGSRWHRFDVPTFLFACVKKKNKTKNVHFVLLFSLINSITICLNSSIELYQSNFTNKLKVFFILIVNFNINDMSIFSDL